MEIKPGTRVKIFDLNTAQEYNNTLGTVVKYNEKHDRWEVKCDYDGKTK